MSIMDMVSQVPLWDNITKELHMKIRQIRNATVLLDYGDMRILVDPMLARKGAIPSLKYLTKVRLRNPLVDLPSDMEHVLTSVTHVLITHCQKGHFDHLDRAGIKWIRSRKIPVLCSSQDEEHLKSLGLSVVVLKHDELNLLLGFEIKLIPCVHGEGLIGKFMAHGYGYILKSRFHPTVYIVGDTLLTNEVEEAMCAHHPDVVIMPGGGARFDVGDEIIMGLEDVLPMAENFNGSLIVNHLEALDHCPVTRSQVLDLAQSKGLLHRIKAPEDGEELVYPSKDDIF
jgi:L-ascorbate metabolism protein UlaG (beta-lactamase superfamily)